jgi:hypothetical protein
MALGSDAFDFDKGGWRSVHCESRSRIRDQLEQATADQNATFGTLRTGFIHLEGCGLQGNVRNRSIQERGAEISEVRLPAPHINPERPLPTHCGHFDGGS